jgi:two-component system, chemotaxis family, sensor kinase Cph1
MQGLTRDFLAYSHTGTDSKVLHKIYGETALKEALINLRGAIKESGAIVMHDLLPGITSHDRQLVQVLQNLIWGTQLNTEVTPFPLVHVSATKNSGKEWIFSVRDNGLGIALQYLEKIFIIFQRLHGRQGFNGTGIGLAICKKMVEAMGRHNLGRILTQ